MLDGPELGRIGDAVSGKMGGSRTRGSNEDLKMEAVQRSAQVCVFLSTTRSCNQLVSIDRGGAGTCPILMSTSDRCNFLAGVRVMIQSSEDGAVLVKTEQNNKAWVFFFLSRTVL